MEQEKQAQHKRRVHYSGKYPKRFEEKYKEHNPEKYDFLRHNQTRSTIAAHKTLPLIWITPPAHYH